MTIQDVDARLPGGFHDALLHGYHVDLVSGVAKFDVEVCTGDPGAADYPSRERYERGCLTLKGLVWLVTEPPDPTYSGGAPYLIDLCAAVDSGIEKCSDVCFTDAFFCSSTNSFIRFRAREADFEFGKK